MRTLPALVSVVCALATLLAGVAGAGHERARATELRAQCLFADPEFDLAPVSRDRLTAVLEAHVAAHGWRAERESDLGAPAKCPDGVLDQLHAAWADDGKFLPFIAVALERNGRIDAALALLSDEIPDNAIALWHRVPDRVEAWLLAVGPEERAALVARTVQSGARADALCNALLDLGAPGERVGEDGPTRLVAQCLFVDPRVDLAVVPRYRLGAVLDAHALGHRWAAGGEADFVTPTACPPEALDHLMRGFFEDGRHLEKIAVALERNARVEDAFELVRDAIEQASEADEGRVESDTWHFAAFGARLAARAGRHADVLAFAESWLPHHWCGTCAAGLSTERVAVVASALAALGREDELVALAMTHDWAYDAGLNAVIALVGLESSRHGTMELEDVVEKHLVPRFGEKIGAERLRFAGRALANQRVVVVVDADNAEDSAASARGAVERWLVAMGSERRSALVAAKIASGARASRVMDVLVSLGAPEAAAWVDAVAPEHRESYDAANRAWRVLTGEGHPYDLLLYPR